MAIHKQVDAILPVSDRGDHSDVNVRVRCRRYRLAKTRGDAMAPRGTSA